MRPFISARLRGSQQSCRRLHLIKSAGGYQADPPAARFRPRPPIRSRYSVCLVHRAVTSFKVWNGVSRLQSTWRTVAILDLNRGHGCREKTREVEAIVRWHEDPHAVDPGVPFWLPAVLQCFILLRTAFLRPRSLNANQN